MSKPRVWCRGYCHPNVPVVNDLHACAFQALVEKATGAFKSVGLLCFMMWMSGSQLHIFSMMSTMSGVFQPLSAILSSGQSTCPHSSFISLCLLKHPASPAAWCHLGPVTLL